MKKKIYIAGKVTGLPIDETILKFEAAQKELEARGFEAINPLDVVNDWLATWEEAMKKCIPALCVCDAVYLLPCCNTSPGAKLELAIASNLKIPAFKKVDELYQLTLTEDQKIMMKDQIEFWGFM